MSHSNDSSCPCEVFFEYLDRVIPPIAPCGLAAMLLVLLSSSNFWWSESRVLSRLQRVEPGVQRIVGAQHRLFGSPIFTVEYRGGKREVFLLETDMIQRSYFFRR